ncbi:helix-turn-helix transcriptional regulator [Rhizobium sp. 2TAF27]|uniref:helix-turn-helix transcriptional regulator n=1 Tax=Rhizobium sp. 2TAF27 TaxID=3233013 RepID=UPI003F95D547
MTAENTSPNRMLRTSEAANFTGLSASTLTKLRLAGDGPVYIKLGKAVVYDPTDLSAWLHSKRRRSTTAA